MNQKCPVDDSTNVQSHSLKSSIMGQKMVPEQLRQLQTQLIASNSEGQVYITAQSFLYYPNQTKHKMSTTLYVI